LADAVLNSGDFLTAAGHPDPAGALPTVLVFYALSTLLVGLLFLLMAELRLGNVVQVSFLPCWRLPPLDVIPIWPYFDTRLDAAGSSSLHTSL